MTGLSVLLFLAAIAFGISRWLKLPPIPLLLTMGIVLQFLLHALGIRMPEEMLQSTIELGLAVLVFSAGVDLSPRRVRGRLRPVLIVSMAQFSALGVAGLTVAYLLGYDTMTALYLGCALSASSTLVVVRHLQQRRQMFEPFGRLVIGVLLLQDLFILVIIVVLVRSTEGGIAVLTGLGATTLLGLLSAALHRWGVPWAIRCLKFDDEGLLVAAFAMLFVFAALANLMELPFIVGAFWGGFVLSAFPMNGLVRGMLGSISGFFLALFFICIGAMITMPEGAFLWHGFIFVAVLLVVTLVLVALVAEYVGLSTRASVETALLLSQTSEFSLVLAMYGVMSGHISQDLFSMIVLITVGTMTLTPFIARDAVSWRLMRMHPRYRSGEQRVSNLENHVVILGFGRSGSQVLRTLQDDGCSVVVVDEDAAVVRRLIGRGVPCIQGDGSDESILVQCNASKAAMVICSMRRTADAFIVLDYLRNKPTKVLIRVFEPTDADQVREKDGIPVLTSEASASVLLQWVETNHPVDNLDGRGRSKE